LHEHLNETLGIAAARQFNVTNHQVAKIEAALADYPYFRAFWRGTKLGILRQTLGMNKYYLIANPTNLVLRRCSSSSSCVQSSSCQGQRTSKGETIRFWSVLNSSTRSADGFVILPSVRHESTMTPVLFNTLAIGAIPAYPSSEIAHTGQARSDSLRPVM